MTLDEFLSTLAARGLARVAPDELELADGPALEECLLGLHRRAALELPGAAPALELEPARRGALLCHRLAAGISGGRSSAAASSWSAPETPASPTTPAAAFSADLALRWLPDLDRLALGLAADDPRRASLRAVARAYPLSSVGVRGIGAVDPGILIEHPGLARLYVDRALTRGAPERLTHPLLVELARSRTPCSEARGGTGSGPP